MIQRKKIQIFKLQGILNTKVIVLMKLFIVGFGHANSASSPQSADCPIRYKLGIFYNSGQILQFPKFYNSFITINSVLYMGKKKKNKCQSFDEHQGGLSYSQGSCRMVLGTPPKNFKFIYQVCCGLWKIANLQTHKRSPTSHFCVGVRANGKTAQKLSKNDNIQKWA